MAAGLWISTAAAQPMSLRIEGAGAIYPESITHTAAGDLIVGSAGTGAIYRGRPRDGALRPWITPEASGMGGVLGVLAHDRSNTLFACSALLGPPSEAASRLAALRTFDLKTGAAKATYPIPHDGPVLCNDIAVAGDGSAYVAETRAGRILRLAPGAAALEDWVKDPRLAGVDGIAVGGDGAVYVNTVSTGRMFRVPVAAGGAAGPLTELKLTLPLGKPDGLRSLGGQRFLQSESGAERVSEVVVAGDTATVIPLKTGLAGVVAATQARGVVWSVNAKFAYRSDPALKGQDPQPFTVDGFRRPGR